MEWTLSGSSCGYAEFPSDLLDCPPAPLSLCPSEYGELASSKLQRRGSRMKNEQNVIEFYVPFSKAREVIAKKRGC